METRIEKLRELSLQREQAQDLNFEATKKEDFDKQKDNGRILRENRQRFKFQKIKDKMNCEKQGIDYERQKASRYSIEETEAWNKKQKEKSKQINRGFSDYSILGFRKYKKLISNINPDLEEYKESQKLQSTRVLGFLDYQPPKEKVNEMINDLEKQIQKRKTFSKRRKINEDEDVTYINDRNYRFNRKIARAFDPYTEEMKQNVERGTAL